MFGAHVAPAVSVVIVDLIVDLIGLRASAVDYVNDCVNDDDDDEGGRFFDHGGPLRRRALAQVCSRLVSAGWRRYRIERRSPLAVRKRRAMNRPTTNELRAMPNVVVLAQLPPFATPFPLWALAISSFVVHHPAWALNAGR